MGTYDAQQVCLNGHRITARFHGHAVGRSAHCSECGAAAIHQCPNCQREIRGAYQSPGVLILSDDVAIPEHCDGCGAAFPWQGKRAAEAREAAGWGAPLQLLTRLFPKFHSFARQLRHRHDTRTTLEVDDEYDVQDALHALMRLFFDDIRPEEWTPSYAGGSARMDFLLKAERVVVEVKKTRKGLGSKEVGDQLLIDIGRYKSHPDCKTLVCFVYDPDGRIANPTALERDLTTAREGLDVSVHIWPKA